MDEQKHNGRLPPMIEPKDYHDDTAYVGFEEGLQPPIRVSISGGYTVGYVVEESSIYLDAKQALSLLAWLKQEQGTLEQLLDT